MREESHRAKSSIYTFAPLLEIAGNTVRRCTIEGDGQTWYMAEDIRHICRKPRGTFRKPCRWYMCGIWPNQERHQLVTFDEMMRFATRHSPIPLDVWVAAAGEW